jgi:hypothetical protein
MPLRVEAIVVALMFASCGTTPTNSVHVASTAPASPVQQQQQPTSTAREYFSLLANELRTKAAAYHLAVSDADQAGTHNSQLEEERRLAREEEDLASVYDIAAQEGTRAPLCTPLHESEIRDAAADEDETYQRMQPVEQAMPSGTAREQLVKFNTFTKTAAAAFRSDVNACDTIHSLQQQDEQLQKEESTPHHVDCEPNPIGGGFSCTQY